MKKCGKMFKTKGAWIKILTLAIFFFGLSYSAHANMVLYLNDPVFAGYEVIVVDNMLAGTATIIGNSTAGDINPSVGQITYIGPVGAGVFSANVTTGTSKPIIFPGKLDLNDVTTSTGAGTLFLGLTDTGYLLPGQDIVPMVLTNIWGGTTNGTVSAFAGLDYQNGEFGLPTGLDLVTPLQGLFGPGGFNSTVSATSLGPIGPNPFSLSEFVTINHTAAGQISSFNKETVASPIPEPATMLLLGSGLVGLAGFARRRFKK